MDIKSILTDHQYQFVLQGLYKGTIEQINHRAKGHIILDYPELNDKLGISNEDSHRIVDKLFNQGFLQRKTTGQTLACPKDNSVHIHGRLGCCICASDDVAKSTMIEHYRCSNIDLKENYIKNHALVCPECSRKLQKIGFDYKTRPTYICRKCGERMTSPTLQFECKNYGHKFSLHEANTIELHSYTLTANAREQLDRALFNFEPIISYLESLGFKVKNSVTIPGFSGLKHRFDILGLKPGEKRKYLLLKLASSTNVIQIDEIEKIFAEVLDTRPDYSIIVACPESSSEAKYFAESKQITIVDGRNAEEVVHKLRNYSWMIKSKPMLRLRKIY